uniref:Transposase (Putative), gypsy type n=1 Tax=Tanacetum cinerariifolium TaxID=118510 RepID=A0A6L2J901_TANCI|nr:hypothetical protein [Tanacetum cinerariifolium]
MDYSEAAGITRAKSETEEVNSGLKRKRATSGDGAGSSKRVRHVILGDSASTEGEAMDASPTTAAKDVTKTPPPQGGRETGPKVFEGIPADQLMEEIDMKDEAIALLKAQLADARVEVESVRSYAHKLAEEKMSLLVQLDQERARSTDHIASCHWVVKYLEGAKNNHFDGLEEFRQGVEERLEKQEGKLRKLSIEYDEELYPHLVSSIAERRAKAMEELHENKLLTVPAAQVPGYNKDAYEELVAAMEKMKLLELPHIAQLERDQDYPIDVIMAGLTLARHDTEGAEAQSDFFLKPDVVQLQVPIFARPHDILNPFDLEKEIPLKESLEAHFMRLAKKK